MKHVFFALLLFGLIGISQSASAQFSLGFVGVFNLPNLSVDVEGITSTLGTTGLAGGIVAEIQLSENITVSTQPMYLPKGAGLKTDHPNVPSRTEINLDLAYIEVPVLLKYFITNDVARPYVIAGPSFGFLSKAEEVISLDAEEQTLDVKDDFESTDLSILFGGGVDVPMGSATFFLDGRYAIGLTDISMAEDESVKTKGFQIALGAKFRIGGS